MFFRLRLLSGSSSQNDYHQNSQIKFVRIAGVGLAAFGFAYYFKNYRLNQASALERVVDTIQDEVDIENFGKFIDGLPIFTSDEVSKHQDDKTGVWISYRNGVYDITSFIHNHPGKSQITD